MSGRVILYGDLKDRYEAERLLGERFAELHVESFARSWDFVERACEGSFDVAVLLRGAITEHQQRIETVASLRRNEFHGRIIFAGAFLTEKHDAIAAGADYVIDPDKQVLENVIAAALARPRVAADHPYLRYLFVGEWATLESVGDVLPADPPDVLLLALSCHPDAAFYPRVAAYLKAHEQLRALMVEDIDDEGLVAEAMGAGVPNYVVLAKEGLPPVIKLVRQFLREAWFTRVARA
ncbi:MAG: hypothetical protein ACM3O7_11145 [Acidobacteriota bacterium]